MNTLIKSDQFEAWPAGLRDLRAKFGTLARIRRADLGNFGDCKPVGEGVSEMRIHTGKGYRVYFMQEGDCVYILLAGGDKSTQQRDIAKAVEMANEKKGKTMKYSKFDVVDYLDSEEAIAAYLSAVMEENDPELLIAALGDIARARGMAKLSEDTGLNRESLYKALRPGAKPRFDTVFRIIKAMNIKIHATVTP